jgi:hypothetical protein
MDPYYFLLVYFASVLHFFYIVYEVCTSPLYSDFSGWKKYEVLFALWLNSGSVEIHCFSAVQLLVGAFAKEVGRFDEIKSEDKVLESIATPLSALVDDEELAWWYHVIPVFLLPILITHIVSSSVIFIPLFLLIFLILGCVIWWIVELASVEVELQFSKFKLFSLLLVARVISSFFSSFSSKHSPTSRLCFTPENLGLK